MRASYCSFLPSESWSPSVQLLMSGKACPWRSGHVLIQGWLFAWLPGGSAGLLLLFLKALRSCRQPSPLTAC